MTANEVTRRDALLAAGLGAAGATLGLTTPNMTLAAPPNPNRKRSLRVAHLTDLHVQPELGAEAGMTACLHHAQSQADRPELIITGGDSIMESLGQDEARTKLQWDIWRRVLKGECSLPVERVIGNHDVWGWNKKSSRTTGKEPRYGKVWAQEALELDQRYRSFDRGGWHFVVLDSTHAGGEPHWYTAKLDEEQFAWLEADLAAVAGQAPVCIVSHIPILSAAAFLDGNNAESGDWRVPGAWMHVDCKRLIALFAQYPNVKLAISGHLHLVDRVDYNGVTYLCNGAVCGGWWKGNNQECDEGYALIDLYDDGSFDCEYTGFDWQPRA